MARGSISKRSIESLKTTGQTHYLWDNDPIGFGIRVTPAGAKSYIYQYRMGGRAAAVRRDVIARVEKMTPGRARERAHELAYQSRTGIDPIDKRNADRKASAAAKATEKELAFDAYAKRYLENRIKAERPRSYAFVESLFRRHATPALKNTAISALSRQDIAKLLDAIPATQPAVRRNLFAVLRKLFNHAKARGDLGASPMDGMTPPPAVASRDRVLSEEELALVLRAAGSLDGPFGPFYLMLFATGQRREEVAGLDWSELDRKNADWNLPRQRSKNGMASIIPLNRNAVAVLDKLAQQQESERPRWPREGLIFTTTGTTSVSGHSRAKARLDAEIETLAAKDAQGAASGALPLSVAPWRLHDARRTLATGLQRLGIRFEVTEAILNHTSGTSRSGVAAVYQRHGWGPEKRAALDAWSEHCDRLLNPAPDANNIISLRHR